MSRSTTPHIHATRTTIGTLFRDEQWWRDQYLLIQNHGYKLPPRYDPDQWERKRGGSKGGSDLEIGQPTTVSTASALFSRYQC